MKSEHQGKSLRDECLTRRNLFQGAGVVLAAKMLPASASMADTPTAASASAKAPGASADLTGELARHMVAARQQNLPPKVMHRKTVSTPKHTPGTKTSEARASHEAEAQYARAVNIIHGIEKRPNEDEVTTLLESACRSGVSDACEDLEGKNMTPPQLVNWSPVFSPPAAVIHEVEGTLVIDCRLPTDGNPKECRATWSLPFMDKPALATIPSWRYQPAAYKGEPVEVALQIVMWINARRQQAP